MSVDFRNQVSMDENEKQKRPTFSKDRATGIATVAGELPEKEMLGPCSHLQPPCSEKGCENNAEDGILAYSGFGLQVTGFRRGFAVAKLDLTPNT
jgi:hypothetical protein